MTRGLAADKVDSSMGSFLFTDSTELLCLTINNTLKARIELNIPLNKVYRNNEANIIFKHPLTICFCIRPQERK